MLGTVVHIRLSDSVTLADRPRRFQWGVSIACGREMDGASPGMLGAMLRLLRNVRSCKVQRLPKFETNGSSFASFVVSVRQRGACNVDVTVSSNLLSLLLPYNQECHQRVQNTPRSIQWFVARYEHTLVPDCPAVSRVFGAQRKRITFFFYALTSSYESVA